jgi:hypothetical protein
MAKPSPKHRAFAGYHSFKGDGGEYGSFHVFYVSRSDVRDSRREFEPNPVRDDDAPYTRAGWYWQAGFPGCLPDSEVAYGPFTSSRAAYRNAQEEA